MNNVRHVLGISGGKDYSIEKRKWYSFKRFWTNDALTGEELCCFSDFEDYQKMYKRSSELKAINREKGLTKTERQEMLKLITRFKYQGWEYRILNK